MGGQRSIDWTIFNSMAKKYPMATGNAILRAYNKAAKTAAWPDKDDVSTIASSVSAGFIMPKGAPKGVGFQVFVKVARFSETLLQECPESGGLLDYRRYRPIDWTLTPIMRSI